VTKHRPWWSKFQQQAAALLCGLLLLNIPSTAWSASHKPSARSLVSKKSHLVKKAPSVRAVKRGPVSTKAAGNSGRDAVGLFGQASFYGKDFQGRRTATGELFDARVFTAASNHFPLGTLVAVHRLDNDRCAIAKVNDRMHARHRRRVIDVSRGVAEYLDMLRAGVVLVRVASLKAVGESGDQATCRAAFASEDDCIACGQPPRLPNFSDLLPGREQSATDLVLP
jgi:rare lipoprotein A